MDTNQSGDMHSDISESGKGRSWNEALFSWHQPSILKRLDGLMRTFSPAERMTLYILTIMLAVGAFALLASLNNAIAVEEPARGGKITEGVVGTPRFINPLLAISDADRDLTRLVYSGLMRATPEGELIPDIAESYSISEDGKTYTFTLKESAVFHDDTPITARDIAFTIRLAQTPEMKSPKRADWEGVTVEVANRHEIRFTLPRSYAPFIENTTLGILPEHLWSNVSPDEFPFHRLNMQPIGSGPYEVADFQTDSSGAPTEYTLEAFDRFTLGEPHVQKLVLRFFANEDSLVKALRSRSVESAGGLTPANLDQVPDSLHVHRTTLPRVFAIFLNQNKNEIFSRRAVREALDAALDKSHIIETALSGYGTPLDGPIPPSIFTHVTPSEGAEKAAGTGRTEHVQSILRADGWTRNEESGIWENGDTMLAFSLTTSDVPELITTAEEVKRMLGEVGMDVSLEIFAPNDLSTNVVRPREYEALLFGEIVGRTLDLFAFWHSSQRSDPGLNLALYTNSTADDLLSSARVETDREKREETYAEFVRVVQEDTPALFLYAPDFIYVAPENLRGVSLGTLTTPDERFLNIYEWHTETERVWEVFNKTYER